MTPDWMDDARCKGMDTRIFFPDRGQPSDRAKNICSLCPVSAECLEYALDHDDAESERHGVWGGMSERQRRQMRHGMTRHTSCRRCATRFAFVYGRGGAPPLFCSIDCREQARTDTHARYARRTG